MPDITAMAIIQEVEIKDMPAVKMEVKNNYYWQVSLGKSADKHIRKDQKNLQRLLVEKLI